MYMLPHTSIMVCTFQMGVVELLIEVLFFLVLEFYFLCYVIFNGAGFGSSVLLFMSVDFKADVFWS